LSKGEIITISFELKQFLTEAKIIPRESYDAVIKRLIKFDKIKGKE